MLDYSLLCNQKINYSPLVLINTLFDIVKHKTDIQGYWIDNEGKLYIDNIELINYKIIDKSYFENKKRLLFASGEKCIAYKNYFNQLVIEYPKGQQDILKTRIAWLEDKKPSLEYVKVILSSNGGLTVYKVNSGQYLLEVYK